MIEFSYKKAAIPGRLILFILMQYMFLQSFSLLFITGSILKNKPNKAMIQVVFEMFRSFLIMYLTIMCYYVTFYLLHKAYGFS